MTDPEIRKGLAGVVVDETAISKVNPETNSLMYRGYPVQELAATQRFEAVAYLLWNGELPDAKQLAEFETLERSLRGLDHSIKKIIDELRSGQLSEENTPLDVPEHYAPFLRTLLDVVCAERDAQPAELLRLKDVTVELVDLLVDELQSHRDIWSPRKRAAQEELAGQLFDHLMRLRPPLVDTDTAGLLADRMLDQARANHDRLMRV